MEITSIGANSLIQQGSKLTDAKATNGASFGDLLKDALKDLQGIQAEADTSAAKLATGEPLDIHEAMIAMEKTSIAFQLGLQVRNKLIEAHQEIMRMQV